jgi:hypothetical protein
MSANVRITFAYIVQQNRDVCFVPISDTRGLSGAFDASIDYIRYGYIIVA